MTPVGTELFVGRESEMAELRSALDDARSGRGRMVMLAGEPGIGKTRTAEMIASVAEQVGFTSHWGRCSEERGAPAYWPWVQIVRSCIVRHEADSVRAALGQNAGIIAESVPDIARVTPDVETPIALSDPDSARFRFIDAIATFFRNLASGGPLVIALDDIHWADVSSLRLLEHIAQDQVESQIMIVATYRDTDITHDHPLYRTLGDLARRQHISRTLMRGLDASDVGELLEAYWGARPLEKLSSAIHTQTEGSPLFVGKMARFLAQDGVPTATDNVDIESLDTGLPEGIREVIARRLSPLSLYANDVLSIAALIGRDFGFAQLAALVPEDSVQDLLGVLNEAIPSRIIEEIPGTTGQFRFSHALIQQTLRENLDVGERINLHARIAEGLEALYGDEAEDHAAELALHFGEAVMVLGAEKAIHYSLLAGERSLEELAFETASGHFDWALQAQADSPIDEKKARTLYGYGISQGFDAEMGKGLVALDQAFDFYFQNRDYVRAVEAMSNAPTVDPENPENARRLRQALEVVDARVG